MQVPRRRITLRHRSMICWCDSCWRGQWVRLARGVSQSALLRLRGHDSRFSGFDNDLVYISGRVGSIEIARRSSCADEAVDIRRELARRFPRQIVADVVGLMLVAGWGWRPYAILLPIEVHPFVGLTCSPENLHQPVLRRPREAGIFASPQYERRNRQRIQSLRRVGRRGGRIDRAPTRQRLPRCLRGNGLDYFRGG